MPEKTKEKIDENVAPKNPENFPPENSESGENATWSRDRKERSYYYDDGYGYEIYNPDEDDETENC